MVTALEGIGQATFADEDGCSSTCDYCGAYSSNKCLWKCGNPSQRWYTNFIYPIITNYTHKFYISNNYKRTHTIKLFIQTHHIYVYLSMYRH